jgi:hypothetical protein
LKNEVWSYEQGVRLRLLINESTDNKKVKISLEKVDFSDVTLTFASWVKLDKQYEITDSIQSLRDKYNKIQKK